MSVEASVLALKNQRNRVYLVCDVGAILLGTGVTDASDVRKGHVFAFAFHTRVACQILLALWQVILMGQQASFGAPCSFPGQSP